MKTFTETCAQGDVYFRRVAELPSGLKSAAKEKDGTTVVAHSETQHHHSFPKDSGVELFTSADPFICYLRVETASMLEHHRPNHTHEAVCFDPGIYEIRRQRERAHTPQGWANRMVQD